MKLGIDLGSSTTDIVVMNNNTLVFSKSVNNNNSNKLNTLICDLTSKYSITNIFTTGCGTLKIQNESKIPVIKIDEIKAIGLGGSFVSNNQNVLVVSIGSGTCIVSKKAESIQHLGGTAIGGKTLTGLSNLLIGTEDINLIESLASKGNLNNIDLTLKQIYPEGIGLLPNSATASHFGDIKSKKREDIALALINMISQTIGTLAVFAAKSEMHINIVLTGKVTNIKIFKDLIESRINSLHNIRVKFPKNAEFATAIGATIIK